MKKIMMCSDYRRMVWGVIFSIVLLVVFSAVVHAEVYQDPVFRRYYKKDRPRAVKRDLQEEQVRKTCVEVIEEHELQLPERISYFTEKESPEKKCRDDGVCAFRFFYPQDPQLAQSIPPPQENTGGKETQENAVAEKRQLKFKGFLKGQILEDVYKEFYESGQLRLEISYKDGKRNGLSKFFYETGVLRTEKNYKNGLPDGAYRGFYSNSKVKVEAVFQDGSGVGAARTYYNDGTLMREENYTEDKVDGLVRTFYKDGTSRGEYRYQGGKLKEIIREFYADGTLKEPVTPLDETRIPAQ